MTLERVKLMLLALAIGWSPLHAEMINLQVSDGIWATAEYVEGDDDKPVVMIVHGFLQTREFSTVSRLGNSLKEEGYTVFMPTLSLNVDQRKQSVACEAIHSHTMQADIEELNMWLNWLIQKTDRPVTLLGHSTGSTHILALMADKQPSRVSDMILVSLLHFDEDPLSHNTASTYSKALSLHEKGVNELGTYSLSFCAEYPSEPGPFISYRQWGKEKIIAALNMLSARPTVILGENDGRMTPDWIKAVKSTGANVIILEDAGHFFDAHSEFDLLDRVTSQLEKVASN